MKKQILFVLISFLSVNSIFATHNQAGEITFKQINGTTIEASVITYTNLSTPADRDSVYVCWDDGSCQYVLRVNGPDNDNNGIPDGEPINFGTKKNIYTKLHTYSGLGNYTISMTDPNRSGNILNVNPPNSENVPFIINAEFVLLNPNFNEFNSSPILLQAPIDIAFIGEPFMHSPNAFDIEGDSIAYELITPIGVPNYYLLTEIGAGPNNTLTFNEETGLLIWNAPQVVGQYTIAYAVKSYRDGLEIDRIIRDMLIEVVEGPGFAPEITMANISSNEEIILVDLGDTVSLDITINDLDIDQTLEVFVTTGLIGYFDNDATFVNSINGNSGTANFKWVVKEEHLREQPYQVVFKVKDDTPDHAKSKLAVVRYKTSTVSTSIPEPAANYGIAIFPNPVLNGLLNLQFKNQAVFPKKYMIFNTLGQQVDQGIIEIAVDAINVNSFSKGVYHIIIEEEEIQVISTFVIQ